MADEKQPAKPKAPRKPKTVWVLLKTSVSGNYNGSDGDVIEMDKATADRFIAKGYAEKTTKPKGS